MKIWGVVQHGEGRGRRLGTPTANVRLHKHASDGVYVTETRVGRTWYRSVSFIGAAKTFGRTERWLESHLLDFDEDIYGEWITVRFHTRIRGNRRFDSVEELIQAMKRDIEATRHYFQK